MLSTMRRARSRHSIPSSDVPSSDVPSSFVRPSLVRPSLVLLLLALVVWLPASASADVLESTGASADFFLPGTWNNISAGPALIPGAADTARVLTGHTVELDQSVTVDIVEIQPGGILRVTDHNVVLALASLLVEGDLEGETGGVSSAGGKRINILPAGGATLQVTVLPGGTIRGGAATPPDRGGAVFIHDPAGGDIPCPTGSSIEVLGGTIAGGDTDGNVYMVADMIRIDGGTVLGGSGAAPYNLFGQSVAGSIYIAGTTVEVINNSLVESGSNVLGFNRIAGSVKILGWSCSGPGVGDVDIIDSNILVGGPGGPCPGALVNGANTTTIAGTSIVSPFSAGCVYWDPPTLELADDATVAADIITVVGEDFDARGLQSRTTTAPALDAADILEIKMLPGGSLDLRGLTPGIAYFSAGAQIDLCVEPDQVLTDADATVADFMQPAPTFCPPETVVRLDMPVDQAVRAPVGSIVEHPVAITNVGNVVARVKISIADSRGWLLGGAISESLTLRPGEPWTTILRVQIPDDECVDEVKIVAQAVSGAQQVSNLAVIADLDVCG